MADGFYGVPISGATITQKVRARVGAWIFGRDMWFTWCRLWIVHERAKAAVSEDGMVTLANCQALADALYVPPGAYVLTTYVSFTRIDPPAAADGAAL